MQLKEGSKMTFRPTPVRPLSPVRRDVVYSVFQDCVDQLGILGGIIPNYAAKPSALDKVSR